MAPSDTDRITEDRYLQKEFHRAFTEIIQRWKTIKTISQDACLSFLTANGLFRKRRNISIGGAITNIVVSLLLMKPFGVADILAGTAVSQVYYWVARNVVAPRECLNQSWRTFAFYWVKQLGFFAVIAAAIWLSSALTQQLFVLNGICDLHHQRYHL